jgi:hypothetical protein
MDIIMPRPLRICRPNATYHCYSRCIEKRDMLSPDYVQDIAVFVVKRALAIYDFKLIQLGFPEKVKTPNKLMVK